MTFLNPSDRFLIAAAVGPVQEFIAAARKLRDLWYGSFLLSELSKTVARSFLNQECQLIFPAIEDSADLDPNSPLNVANKIIALSPENAGPGDILEKARHDYLSFWQELSNAACKKLKSEEVRTELFNSQVQDFGEFFGAWVKSSENYDHDCRDLERRLAGRKTLRNFEAPDWDGFGLPKSSLDGMRESVLKNPALLVKRNLLKKHEQLDALGVVKRLGSYIHPRRPHFNSFSEIAIQPYVEGLRAGIENGQGFIPIILEKISKQTSFAPDANQLSEGRSKSGPSGLSDPFPDEFFLMSRLEEWLRDHDLTQNAEWKDIKHTLQKELYRLTGEPQPYASLLVGDGDFMGSTIDQLKEMASHQDFSRALAQFAAAVAEEVARYEGRLIYSGGDDVMAYVPLHRMLDCAVAVNACFYEEVGEACNRLGSPQRPTFSMGVAVVHHLMPLQDALEMAREAEAYAKNEAGRNALTIVRAKRSGAPITVAGKWSETENQGFAERLQKLCSWYEAGRLPSRLAYDLKSIARKSGWRMQWEKYDDGYIPANPVTSEALRAILRKQGVSEASFERGEAVALLIEQMDLRRFADELVVSYQLAQANLMAKAAWKRQKESDI